MQEENKWIPHDSNECPIPDGTLVDVKFRNGEITYNTPANISNTMSPIPTAAPVFWEKMVSGPHGHDIVAWRPSKELKSHWTPKPQVNLWGAEHQSTKPEVEPKRASRVVGICGKAGAGKDTAADYLVKNYGFTKISFAAILKDMMRVAGMPEPANRDDKEKAVEGFEFSWRDAAQKLGTEWGRSLDQDIWVKLTLRSLDPNKNYVISDARFDNEADAIRNSGGSIIHLTGRQVDLGTLSQHASEKGVTVKGQDTSISNSGDIGRLHTSLDWFMQQ